MTRFRPAALALAAALALPTGLMAPALQAQSPMDDAQRKAVEEVVRDYILKNPEIILEAVDSLQKRQKMAEEQKAKTALAENKAALFQNPADPVAGNPKGDVTVVEFFDYQCGYCKAVQADTERLIKDDGKLRFVFKEFPILSPASLTAAKAALASRGQGKYLEFHNALMAHRGQLDDDVIQRLAKSVGLDTDKLKKDMNSPEVLKVIAANQALAEELGIRGTPAFIIGDELVPGAIKLDQMKDLVAAARKG
ncbi:DsbA family protein [Azospirillum brasilense]|uniref:DsbA family protein n=1 Tax=Azospirillum brasilense TaxID=192 RepID=UPI000E6A33D9|nr:DsbA family protein [Azospirillum brasilense]NUB24814.1 thioredoxin domain-containing protein [Azospirillum brasilense]NUB31125.1 thioredoxin domain-containing protein [Azospirillum brasilense]RIV98189.1 DsbA family protein [Azospirillum brasilense]